MILGLFWLAWSSLGEEAGPWSEVVARSGNSSWIRQLHVERDAVGNKRMWTNQWVQVEDGLNYWDSDAGGWMESKEEIVISGKGALAEKGQHRVFFASNANDPEGAVDLEIRGALRIRSSILALRYFDSATGQVALLGMVRDVRGELLKPNQVIYRGVFDELRADLVYTYRRNGLEADIVLREIPPTPVDLGLNPETTRIEVVTEFLDPPEPLRTQRVRAQVTDVGLQGGAAELDWIDEELDFGVSRIAEGRAFAWSAREAAERRPEAFAPVAKRWLRTSDRRTFLVESVGYAELLEELLELPGTEARRESTRAQRTRWAGRGLLETRKDTLRSRALALRSDSADGDRKVRDWIDWDWANLRRPAPMEDGIRGGIQLAVADSVAGPGLVVDWNMVNVEVPDFTFASTNTYWISGKSWLVGTTTFEGGTVIKFADMKSAASGLILGGPVVFRTSAYRPAVFTAESDNSLGDRIVAGTPADGSDFGGPQLRFTDSKWPLLIEHVRMKHGFSGVQFDGNRAGVRIRHSQFVECRYPVLSTAEAPIWMENVLIHGGKPDGVALSGVSTPVFGEHLTVHQVPRLSSGVVLSLTNSIVAEVERIEEYAGSGNRVERNAAGLFESVGAGRYYLAPGSPLRNRGVSGIRNELRRDLAQMTTEAPRLLPSRTDSDLTLVPVVARDSDEPDIGYHYAPIDYVASRRFVTQGTLHARQGVVVGVYGTAGIVVGPGGRVLSVGSPAAMNRFVYYGQVQEQTQSPWLNAAGDLALFGVVGGFETPVPEIVWRFTEAVMPAGPGHRRLWVHDVDTAPVAISVSHSQLTGLALSLEGQWAGSSLVLTNNLLEDVDLRLAQYWGEPFQPIEFRSHHQLFRGGKLILFNERSDTDWTFQDNLVDSDELVAEGITGLFSHNGFRSGLPAFGESAIQVGTMDFQESLVGRFTYPHAGGAEDGLARLVDAGSRSAGEAGLVSFAVGSRGDAEGDTQVDIGFHYPASSRAGDGLVALWEMEEGQGTVLTDSTGAGNSGLLLNGTSWVGGQEGTGLRFDGVNDWVNIPDSSDLRFSGSFTVAFWIRKDSESSDWVRWVGKGGSSARNYGVFGWPGGSGRVLFQFQTEAGGISSLSSQAALRLGRWYHVACVWDGGGVGRIYLDGRLDAEGEMPGTPVTSLHPVTLGYAGFHTFLAGAMDEVALFDRALNLEEILKWVTLGGGRDSHSSPVSHWGLDEASGLLARDTGRARRHGRVVGDGIWTPGVLGNALTFDGSGDAVVVGDAAIYQFQGPFSIAFWYRKNSEKPDWVRLVGKGGLGLRNFGVFDWAGESGQVLFQFSVPGGGYSTLTSRTSIAVGGWHHVVCTWEGGRGRIYVDGELDAEGPMAGPPVITTDPVTLGRADFHDGLDGAMDEVRLYDRVLSGGEVRLLVRHSAADADGDGVADLVEDENGNGIRDGAETSRAEPDTDLDGRSDAQERLDGTDPGDSRSVRPVRLGLWNFDNPRDPWRGDNDSEPWERTGVGYVELESFVYGAELNGAGAALRYREVEEDGRSNISLQQGTIRLHYFPYWVSAYPACGLDVAGIGPGAPIELLSIGDFSIQIDAKGTNLVFRSPDGVGGWVTNAQAGFRACVGDYPPDFPMDIQVSYATNASALFINGQMLARGQGIRALPTPAERARGIFVGSSPDRTSPARGVVDALFTYNVPLGLTTNAAVLRAAVSSSPPSITLRWEGVSNGVYRVERRTLAEREWRHLASVTPPQFTDTEVVSGTEYEYRLTVDAAVPDELKMLTDPAPATATAAVEVPVNDLPGHVLLVVDRTLLSDMRLASAVEGLAEDLWAEGWVVGRYDGPRHDDREGANNAAAIAEVKQWIQSYRASNPGGVGMVYLLGHLPIPFSGLLSPDGHGYRPLPADAYYGDLDGRWTDVTNWVATPGIVEANLAGDGQFDQELVPANSEGVAAVELAVGRVDFAGMPSFASGANPRSEVDLLVQYLGKTRRFRRAEVVLPERAVYGAYFSTNAIGEATDRLTMGVQKLGVRLGIAEGDGDGRGVVGGDFFAAGLPAIWGIQGGFAGNAAFLNSRGPVNRYHGVGAHRSLDLTDEAMEPPIAFSLLEGSWMSEWHQPDHLGRALLATKNYGYAWSYAGAARIEWQYPVMALGRSLGEAWMKTQNDAWMWPLASVLYQSAYGTGVRVNLGVPSQGGYVFASLLGDPTLRQSVEPPPKGVMGLDYLDDSFALFWEPAADARSTYHVYRSRNGPGSGWVRLNEAPLLYPWFVDWNVSRVPQVYMVRTVVVKPVGTGSVARLSAGTLYP